MVWVNIWSSWIQCNTNEKKMEHLTKIIRVREWMCERLLKIGSAKLKQERIRKC